jgi:hypothetical protein
MLLIIKLTLVFILIKNHYKSKKQKSTKFNFDLLL